MPRKYTLCKVEGKHLTFRQRQIIEMAYNENLRKSKHSADPAKSRLSLRPLAASLGIKPSSLCRELKRGILSRPNTYRNKDIRDYSAQKAQDDVDAGARNKGRAMKMNTTIAKLLQIQILGNNRSPYDAVCLLAAQLGPGVWVPSVSSVYNHIWHGDIGVFYGQTPYHPRKRRVGKTKAQPRRARNNFDGTSIEERPDLSSREQFGHWEMDTVVSCVGGQGGLLVLIERRTRRYVIRKLRSLCPDEIRHVLAGLLRSGIMGRVRSITTDNGSEFLPAKEIETLFKAEYGSFALYYTHAYASWEKGSVENANRFVRRWYPKGTDFARVSVQALSSLETAINSIHRRIFEGQSAQERFLAELAASVA